MSQVSTLADSRLQPLPTKRNHNFVDETDNEHGSWTVLGYAGKDKQGYVMWLCRCKCGNKFIVSGVGLRAGNSTQCKHCSAKESAISFVASGAWKASLKKAVVAAKAAGTHRIALAACIASGASARNREKGAAASIIHNLSHHSLYHRWIGIHYRCYNPKCKAYSRYGARGINVCLEWHRDNLDGLKNFVEWFEANKPITVEKLELHRRDNDGDYSSKNVQILTEAEHKEVHRQMKENACACPAE